MLSWEREAGVREEGVGVRQGDGRKKVGDRGLDCLPGTGTLALEALLALGEGLFGGIEVGGVGRQEAQLATGGLNRRSCPRVLVGAQVVEDHGLAGTQARHQHALDKGDEDAAIHRAIDDQAGAEPIGRQRRNPDNVEAMAAGNVADGSLPYWRPGT